MYESLNIFDLILPPIYLGIFFIYGQHKKNKGIITNPEFAYFMPGLFIRILGAICLGLIYFFYYEGGDTINYFDTASAYAKLLHADSGEFFEGWFTDRNWLSFNWDDSTGYPMYHPDDHHAFFVVRLLIPIVTLGGYSYFASAIITAAITYGGLWKLYQTFLAEFPHLKRELAIACLFIPSCVFWGAGIMKDSFTLSAIGWYTYGFYFFFIQKKFKISYAVYIVVAAYIIVSIKPYILFALLPGSILWLTNAQIKKIDNKFFRAVLGPAFIGVASVVAVSILDQMGDSLGAYKLDTVLDKAVLTQQDMKAAYYGGKSFDIGDFDASTTGVAMKAPAAIFAGIFRPGLWDVRNVVMLVAALENTYLLMMTFFLMTKLRFLGFFRYINRNPLVLFSMLFSLFFAFSVGLTVANFGSLVRLRIPELPFFVASILIMRHYYEKQSGKKMRI